MKNTKFTNPSGANNKVLQPYEPKKYKNDTISHTSARDMAILSTNLLKEHPDVLKLQSFLKIHNLIKSYIIQIRHYQMKQML